MSKTYNVLIMGASYGSLLGTKLLLADHNVTLVCTAGTAALINKSGTVVRLPVRGREELVSVESKTLTSQLTSQLTSKLRAATPESVDPAEFDLVVLAMQEPQYSSPGVRELLDRVAQTRVPSMAIMNMPPLPYLKRLPGLNVSLLEDCFAEPSVWENFDPDVVTLASPDPQAFRPPDEAKNILQVGLPTNFKVARFESAQHNEMLREMQTGIEAVQFPVDGGTTELPVKMKVYDSLFVPLAKWSMLVTGNYRCVMQNDMQSIRDAVHSDIDKSAQCYQWVVDLCVKLGASPKDMVPFDKYANAAKGLAKPSSAARALFGGAANIERVDKLVREIASQHEMQLDSLDKTVEYVDARLEINRAQAST